MGPTLTEELPPAPGGTLNIKVPSTFGSDKYGKTAKRHNTLPAFENSAPENRQNRMRIPSGKEKPANAFVAVRNRDHWF